MKLPTLILFLCITFYSSAHSLDTIPTATCDSFIVYEGEATFDDGSGSNFYSPNLDCIFLWVNSVNSTNVTEVSFDYIDLGPGDTLMIYKGYMGCGTPLYILTEEHHQFFMFLNQPLFHMHFVSDGSGEGQGWEFTTDVTNFFSHPEEYGEALTIHREPINYVGIPFFASSFSKKNHSLWNSQIGVFHK